VSGGDLLRGEKHEARRGNPRAPHVPGNGNGVRILTFSLAYKPRNARLSDSKDEASPVALISSAEENLPSHSRSGGSLQQSISEVRSKPRYIPLSSEVR